MTTPCRESPIADHRLTENGLGGSLFPHPDHPDCAGGESTEPRIYLGTEGTAVTEWGGTLQQVKAAISWAKCGSTEPVSFLQPSAAS
ncbi:MAG: hypothetical protein MPN21_27715 [Thermoanaerobaculia bacterium]|nr:hypothetical protein [Thermoanaerobaculia bacterium]